MLDLSRVYNNERAFKPMVFPAFQYCGFTFRNMSVAATLSSPNTTLLHRLAAVNHLSFALMAQFCFSVPSICSSHFLPRSRRGFFRGANGAGSGGHDSEWWVLALAMSLTDCVVGLWRVWTWKIGGEGRRVDSASLVIRYCGTLHQYVSCSPPKLSHWCRWWFTRGLMARDFERLLITTAAYCYSHC